MELEVNGKIAQLPIDASIPLKIHNPAFHKMGTYSEPFSMVRYLNRVLMQFVEEESKLSEVAFTFKLRLGNEVFLEGDLGVNDTTLGYKCYLKSGKGAIANVLKNSYLDGEINGQSWGDNPGGLNDINDSVNGIYPDKKFVVAPVKIDDETINDWIDGALTSADMAAGKMTPMVYVRHIIDRISQACNLLVGRNDFDMLDDFKRLCLFSPRKDGDNTNSLLKFNEWMPHITSSEFLNDLEERFNMIAFFSPYSQDVDYIHFDNLFSGRIVDWTNKFLRDDKRPPFQEGLTLLKNDAEDDDVLSPREIEQKYDITEVATFDDLDRHGGVQKVLNVNRYFKPVQLQQDNPLSRPLHFDTLPIFGDLFPYRKLIEEIEEDTDELANDDNDANQDNIITSMFFPDDKGQVFDNASIYALEAKVNSGSANLVAKLETRETISGVSSVVEVLGSTEITIDHANYQTYDLFFLLQKAATWEVTRNKDGDYLSGTYLALTLYCNASTSGRKITTRLGLTAQPGFLSSTTVYIDTDRTIFKEVGVLGTKEFGNIDANKVREVEPKSKVVYNDIGLSGGYHFQMPTSDIDPKLEQKDYAYTIYRGIIDDERNAGKTATYCNFDVVDLEMKDYQSRVTNGATPDLSLSYLGSKGLAIVLHQKRLNWFKNSHMPVRKIFQLNLNDLRNTKMFDRIKVKEHLYFIDIISVKAEGNDKLSEATVDMYTL